MAKEILVTRHFSDKWISYLKERFNVTLWNEDSTADRDWLLSNLKGKDGAIVMLTDKVDREFMDHGTDLKVISTMSVGYEHIDIENARSRGITICNTPGVLTESTADTAFSLLLSAARRTVEGDRLIRGKRWTEEWSPTFMLGHEVSGKVLGIYGMGRIGIAVAKRAQAFGMKIMYSSRTRKELPGYEYAGFEDLLSKCDFLVITVSLNEETKHSINEHTLSLMKPSSVLVNVSRGPVVDEHSLYCALRDHKISGAGIDVFEREPLDLDSALMNLENIVLSPHLGSSTEETRGRMAELAATNLADMLEGKTPRHIVK